MTVLPGSSTAMTARMRSRSLLPRLRRGVSRGELGIWLFSTAMLVGGLALLGPGGAWSKPAFINGPPEIFWMLVPAFAASERFVAHVHFRRSAHSMSLAEIPLVFALLFASGRDVVIAGALGRILVLAIDRRLPPIRLAFNLGLFLLGNCLAVLIFHRLAGSHTAIDPTVWVAVAAAAAANSVLAIAAIGVVVSLSEGQLSGEQILGSLRTDLIVAMANTSIGLCATRLVYYDWRTAILLTVPVAGMFLTMRAFAAQRQRHGRLEFLYETARALSGSAEMGEALERLLGQALDTFRAETAEIVFFSPDGADALRIGVHAEGASEGLESLDAPTAAALRAVIARQPAEAFRTGAPDDPGLAEYLAARGLGDGLFARLEGERQTIGAIMIGDPSGTVDRLRADDVKLFETLAHNTSTALENDRLGQTVWQMKKLQGELEHQASHDPLTDLANRVLFTERVAEALRHEDDRTAVIFIDVNEFKAVNDSLGHAAGDELLLAIAGRLRDCVRPGDTLARLGGDEFAILLTRTTGAREEVDVAQRIVRRLEERFAIAGRSLSVGASAGVSFGTGAGVSAEELVRNADLAMYRAKQAGSGYELFETGMELPVLRRHGLKQRLRDATGANSFDVHYQPIVQLSTGAVTAREALVRWNDGPRGIVQPASFIPVAEEMGVIVEIGRQVLHRACTDAREWRGVEPPAVHVNLSPVELRDQGFVGGVQDALSASGLPPERLVLEITESVVLRDPAKAVAILEQLRSLGVQLALDDFGTGYSSLSHLRQLPLDWLKIGQPFVDDIAPDGANRPFMRMILDLAASLGLGVVAEGIETRAQMVSLKGMGCGFGQGYHLGRPAALARPAADAGVDAFAGLTLRAVSAVR
jgi:diguanylate cyclase (GGDEF)-like protein